MSFGPCEGCKDLAPRLPVRLHGDLVALCCTCRKKVERHDATPAAPYVEVDELPARAHVPCDPDVYQLDTLSYINQRGVR